MKRAYEELEFENGEFLGFGVDYEEYENGFAQYTTAIVELQDGQVIVTSPENIQFTITNEDKSKTCIDMPEQITLGEYFLNIGKDKNKIE